MGKRGMVGSRQSKQTRRAARPRLRLELERLEDRTLLSGGNYLIHIKGLAGDTRAVQTAAVETLMKEAGLNQAPIPIQVIDHVGTDGSLWIRTPANASEWRLHGHSCRILTC